MWRTCSSRRRRRRSSSSRRRRLREEFSYNVGEGSLLLITVALEETPPVGRAQHQHILLQQRRQVIHGGPARQSLPVTGKPSEEHGLPVPELRVELGVGQRSATRHAQCLRVCVSGSVCVCELIVGVCVGGSV